LESLTADHADFSKYRKKFFQALETSVFSVCSVVNPFPTIGTSVFIRAISGLKFLNHWEADL